LTVQGVRDGWTQRDDVADGIAMGIDYHCPNCGLLRTVVGAIINK